MSTCRHVASWQFFKLGKSSFFCAKNETSLKQNKLLNQLIYPEKNRELPDCQTPRFPMDLSFQTAAASAFWITLHGLIQLNRRSALALTADCWWMLENGFNFAGTCWIPRGFEKSFSDHGQWIRFHVKWSVHVAVAVWSVHLPLSHAFRSLRGSIM